MCRNANIPYEYKRTHNLLKIKGWYDCECPIVGFKEGLGKYEGTLGAILVSYKDNIVAVGTGLSDCDRDVIWANRDYYKNLSLKIKYFEESTNAKGEFSLRFPTYICFRDAELSDITT